MLCCAQRCALPHKLLGFWRWSRLSFTTRCRYSALSPPRGAYGLPRSLGHSKI